MPSQDESSSDEDENTASSSRVHAASGHANSEHPPSDRSSGDSEVHQETDPEWSAESLEDLRHCLKEEGLSECYHEYVTVQGMSIPKLLRAFGKNIPDETPLQSDELLQKLQNVMQQELRRRNKIDNYNTIGDAVKLLWRAKRVMVLTGKWLRAGISVSCGVPDFRSPDGIYATLKAEGKYDLDDPQDIQLWPQLTEPSITHEFIKLLQDKDKVCGAALAVGNLNERLNQLLRNYTQNIDGLELVAGVSRVFHCHGSFATARCMDCQREVPGAVIKPDVLSGRIPRCQPCVDAEATSMASVLPRRLKAKPKKKKKARVSNQAESTDSDNEASHPKLSGLMKPGITFFGEPLSREFDDQLWTDRDEVDLLVIIGTSLKVRPVSEILAHIPHSIPQILINKTPIEHINPDVVLLGECDKIIEHLCHELEWYLPSRVEERGQPRRKRRPEEVQTGEYPRRLGSRLVRPLSSLDLGLLKGTVLWTGQIIPQIWKSYREKTTVGLSPWLMLIWSVSAIFLGIYAIVQNINIPIIVQPQAFGMLAALSWVQCLYYDPKRPRSLCVAIFIVYSVLFASLEVAGVYATRAAVKAGDSKLLRFSGVFSGVLISVALIPQFIEIYRLREVRGISLLFLAVDISGGVFSMLSLGFKKHMDWVAAITYLGVIILDGAIVLLSVVLNPLAKRRREAAISESSNGTAVGTIDEDPAQTPRAQKSSDEKHP
ncbi:NAD-dependent histone deacetylase sir2 [Serendipita sp. 399]|nr:NAD-dependent histone deacetylase sir2 [Serendipita sp. 399]